MNQAVGACGGKPCDLTHVLRRELHAICYLCLAVFCATIAVAGCGGGSNETSLATEGVTADDIAKYEEDLAAVQGDDSYSEELVSDDEGTEEAGTETTGTETTGTETTGTETAE